MKHLQQFNESIQKDSNTIIDIDYIEDCFIELKDLGIFEIKSSYDYDRENCDICNIFISTQVKPSGKRKVLNDIYRATKNKLEIIDELSYCFEKVKIKYPHMQYQIDEDKKKIMILFGLDTSRHVIRNPAQWVSI